VSIEVRPAGPEDAPFVRQALDGWHGPYIAVHGDLIDASALPALVAWHDGERAGLLTYQEGPPDRGWEIVTIDAMLRGAGVGAALIDALRALAAGRGARRLWLVTTNNNTDALRFYQRLGFDLVALHRDAATAARVLKPGIPEEVDGIPLRHELELRLEL
jgi:ribosomal protein S18 acetylase RimI-like enzyme